MVFIVFMISQSTIPYYNLSGAYVFLSFMMVHYYSVSCFARFFFESLSFLCLPLRLFFLSFIFSPGHIYLESRET